MTAPDNDCTATLQPDTPTDTGSRWRVVIAFHPDPSAVGRAVTVTPDAPLQLGRNATTELGDVVDDAHLSRKHARFEVDAQGVLQVLDSGSHNGTYLNGQRMEVARVRSGDVIGLGRLLLVVERALAPKTEGDDRSWAWRRCLESADTVAPRETSVLLWGASGVGKDVLVQRIHAASGADGALSTLRCGSFRDGAALDGGGLAVLNAARGGTLYLDGIDDASDALQASLLELLEHGRMHNATTGEVIRLPVRVVVSARSDPSGLSSVRADFLHRVAQWVIPVPPLRARPSDIAHLMHEFVRRYAGDEVHIHPELAFRLLRHPWPGNVRELEAVIERAVVERPTDGSVGEFAELDDILAQPWEPGVISTVSRAARSRQPFSIAVSGQWFVTPSGEKHDLARRKILVALLAALATARRDQPGVRLTVADLLTAAWPDDRFVGTAGANRVYVALATLRKLGLREVVIRSDGGYVLDPDAAVQLVDA